MINPNLQACLTKLTVSLGANPLMLDRESDIAIDRFLLSAIGDSSRTWTALMNLSAAWSALKLSGAKADAIDLRIEERLNQAFDALGR